MEEQVTRGNNHVADGWAGEYNPHSHPNPPHTYAESIQRHLFSHILSRADGRMDQHMDRRTDRWLDRRIELVELRVRNLKREIYHRIEDESMNHKWMNRNNKAGHFVNKSLAVGQGSNVRGQEQHVARQGSNVGGQEQYVARQGQWCLEITISDFASTKISDR